MGNMFKPVLFSGLILGVLAGIPVVNFGCCLWALCGGLLGVYFYRRFNNEEVDNAKGALIGFLCGLVAIPIATAFATIMGILFQSAMLSLMSQYLGTTGMEDLAMQDMMGAPSIIYSVITNLIMFTLIFGIFSTLGGLLGAVIFNKNKQGPGQVPPNQGIGQQTGVQSTPEQKQEVPPL